MSNDQETAETQVEVEAGVDSEPVNEESHWCKLHWLPVHAVPAVNPPQVNPSNWPLQANTGKHMAGVHP